MEPNMNDIMDELLKPTGEEEETVSQEEAGIGSWHEGPERYDDDDAVDYYEDDTPETYDIDDDDISRVYGMIDDLNQIARHMENHVYTEEEYDEVMRCLNEAKDWVDNLYSAVEDWYE